MKVEIYPREGTETSLARKRKTFSRLKFIPVRGRKHYLDKLLEYILHTLKFIPVRGRKRNEKRFLNQKRS